MRAYNDMFCKLTIMDYYNENYINFELPIEKHEIHQQLLQKIKENHIDPDFFNVIEYGVSCGDCAIDWRDNQFELTSISEIDTLNNAIINYNNATPTEKMKIRNEINKHGKFLEETI